MRVNAELVAALRKRKSWSQDELATVSGLNLRTIQRIESDGQASGSGLESRQPVGAPGTRDQPRLTFGGRVITVAPCFEPSSR